MKNPGRLRSRCFVVVSLVFLLVVGINSASCTRPESHLVALTSGAKLRVGTTGDYAPFTKLGDDGAYEGLDIEMARGLAGSLAVQVEFVPTTWRELMPGLRAGRYDIAMGGISINLERQKSAYFSLPYRSGGKAVLTACETKARFDTLEGIDRKGVRVIVNPGGTNERFVRANLRKAEIILHKDNITIFSALAKGEADLMITDSVEALLQAQKVSSLCAVRADNPFTFSEMGYLLPQGDEAWKRYVDQWLHQEIASGRYAELSSRWIPIN